MGMGGNGNSKSHSLTPLAGTSADRSSCVRDESVFS